MFRKMLLDETPDEQPDDKKVEKQLRGIRVVYFFDVSQTEGEPIPEPPIRLLSGDTDLYDRWQASCPFPVQKAEDLGGSNGAYVRGEKRIEILATLEQAAKAKTLAHEWAHGLLHDNHQDRVSREIRELEAESVAFVVGERLGLDTSSYSFGYIAHWCREKEVLRQLRESGERIATAARMIIEAMEKTEASKESPLAS